MSVERSLCVRLLFTRWVSPPHAGHASPTAVTDASAFVSHTPSPAHDRPMNEHRHAGQEAPSRHVELEPVRDSTEARRDPPGRQRDDLGRELEPENRQPNREHGKRPLHLGCQQKCGRARVALLDVPGVWQAQAPVALERSPGRARALLAEANKNNAFGPPNHATQAKSWSSCRSAPESRLRSVSLAPGWPTAAM